MKKIALLVDFTPVSQLAMEHLAVLIRQKPTEVILIHVADPSQRNSETDIRRRITEFASPLNSRNLPYSMQVDYGNFFDIIGQSVTTSGADLMFVGTHGISVKGSFAGSNIFKLLQLTDIPALIVQLHSEVPTQGYKKVLLPLIGRTNTSEIAGPVGKFGAFYQSDVHILSFVSESNKTEMTERTTDIQNQLKSGGLKVAVDFEMTPHDTSNYFRSVVELSDIEETEVIVLMTSQKYEGYFSTEDQENILLNRLCKPVLCL